MTLRLRLTAVYGLLFFVAGASVLGVTYLLLRKTLTDQIKTPVVVDGVLVQKPDTVFTPNLPADEIARLKAKSLIAEQAQTQYRQQVLNSLLQEGGLALGAVGVIAVGGGWLAAGRVLRPLTTITETARRVADRSLHERIALKDARGEVRELADTFDEMLERLDRSFDGQRRFVSNASHELKTPLAINRTVIEVAMSRPDAPEQLLRLGEILLEVNARQERLIEGLLTFARSEQTVTDRQPVDLAELAAHAVEQLGGDISWHPELAPAPVAGDPLLLERLVQNLVQNASRHNIPDGWARVQTGVVNGQAGLTIMNTGPSVAAYEVPQLFEPFRRLSDPREKASRSPGGKLGQAREGTPRSPATRVGDRTGSQKGSGLGLSIARSVARAHGGEVLAAARPGGGLVVHVTLPVREN